MSAHCSADPSQKLGIGTLIEDRHSDPDSAGESLPAGRNLLNKDNVIQSPAMPGEASLPAGRNLLK